ncbi:unnamed protein product [Clonostachys chloroleuca]|uniref:Uncharacterized protein n=1 Tax=Clonostachys chloroleuca TaxID=1926264 RepID=A0AA35MK29_9HYPO|nr:unnamed protein product [Clonostachys chloroleuca]
MDDGAKGEKQMGHLRSAADVVSGWYGGSSGKSLYVDWHRCDELDSLLDRSCVWSGGKASSKQYMQHGWLIQTTRRHDDITASRVRAGGQFGGRCTGAGMRERPLP